MKPEEILSVADKNGFDWWDMKTNYPNWRNPHSKSRLAVVFESRNIHPSYVPYSLADLATNKSFLEALQGYTFNQKRIPKHLLLLDFQQELVINLTNNNGIEFWKICSDFIGGK